MAMVRISTGIDEPNTPSTISARMSCGIDMMTSTRRDSTISTQEPSTAAVKPSVMPMKNDSSVQAAAMPMVMRAP